MPLRVADVSLCQRGCWATIPSCRCHPPSQPCANTNPQRHSVFTKDPSDVLDHATSESASGSKLGIDATKKLPGGGFKHL